jgi:formylglycine-generating enzyme required for sulfatase activity
VQSKWDLPAGSEATQHTLVKVRVRFNADGRLAGPPVIMNPQPQPTPYFRAVSDRAIKAVQACEPYNLPPAKYDLWKDIVLNFDPHDFQTSGGPRCDGVEVQVGSEKRCLKPKDSFRDCPNCPEMVVVPAGTFTMGSPANEPERSSSEEQVRVTIPAPFAAGRYAVTFNEWDACVADGGCSGYKPKDQGWGRGKRPVINVSWDDAKAYAAWVSRKTGKTYRLLSESEREYVTRAGTTTPFWWGSSITPKQANYNGSVDPYEGGGSKGENRQSTVPVDSFEPNPWGLYQVHGNVLEWTLDCWNGSNTGNPGDGHARTTGDCSRRVVRGGSWVSNPQELRSAYRYWNTPGVRDFNKFGFRLARTLHP